ncbi:MAG: serine hydrolase domain-containing protein [bacterium]
MIRIGCRGLSPAGNFVSALALVIALVVVMALGSAGAGICAAGSDDAAIPETPAGRHFAKIIAFINAGDSTGLRAYAAENFTPGMLRTSPNDPGILGFLIEQHANFGGWDVIRALDSAPEQVGMLVRSRRDAARTLRYVVGAEREVPHRVSGIFLFPAPADATGSEAPPLSAEDAIAELDRVVSSLADDGRFSGALLLARNGEPVLRRAHGEADRAFHAPNRAETLFSLASTSKMFTGVAIARLVETGRLGWDDTVAQHLDGWLAPEIAARVTVRQLLTHTSGLGDYLDQVFDGETMRLFPDVASYQPLCARAEIAGAPGAEFRYSNLGYVVLGAIIEKVSGRDYYGFVRDEVFARAGMTRTAWYENDAVIADRAVGYCRAREIGREGEGWYTNGLAHGLRGTPAGGAYSNVDDLLAFANALTRHQLVAAATTDSLLAPRIATPMGGDYGYGFSIERGRGGARNVGHSGGFPGVGASVRISLDSGWTLIVLSNLTDGASEVVETWRGLAARITAANR